VFNIFNLYFGGNYTKKEFASSRARERMNQEKENQRVYMQFQQRQQYEKQRKNHIHNQNQHYQNLRGGYNIWRQLFTQLFPLLLILLLAATPYLLNQVLEYN